VDERTFYTYLVWVWIALAVGAFVALLVKTAPYGRFARRGWGPTVPGRLSWFLMECPAVVMMTLLFVVGDHKTAVTWAFLAIWNVHYVYRSGIFPVRIHSGRSVPLFVTASGVVFHTINAYLQGRYLFTFAEPYAVSWLAGGRFWTGLILFTGGLAVNIRSDTVLRSLRRPGETHYAIPRGGLFELVSCPNYTGEMVEWAGWAILTWSLPGLAFAIWTAANLLPRALASHKWYRENLPDYPANRKAVVPWVL
jgi:3-oxo-5-alpha-steroid 4-dehydrogenase 1